MFQATSENSKLKAELDKINKLLEDEKQKVEDLMFRTEEENINREDYNVSFNNHFNYLMDHVVIKAFLLIYVLLFQKYKDAMEVS